MAMTADGKIASENRAIHSFGSQWDQHHLYRLRARADAIMSGATTLKAEGATLGTGGTRYRKLRRRAGLAEYPLRVVVSGSGSIPPQAAVFQRHFSPIILLATHRISPRRHQALAKVADVVKIFGGDRVDFDRALRWLGTAWQVRRLLCEGGAELNAALLEADLVDEVHLTVTPWIFGGRRAPTVMEGKGSLTLAQARHFELRSSRRVADELFLVYRRRR